MNITDTVPMKVVTRLNKFKTNNAVKIAYSCHCKAWSGAAKVPTGKNFHVAKGEIDNSHLKLHQQ